MGLFWCLSCKELESEADKGEEAAEEFCDCLSDGNSKSKCASEFYDKYGKDHTEAFMSAFNKKGEKCNVKLKED
jgi:hypothetical protein